MEKEFKEALKASVCSVIDQDILNDVEVGAILKVCKDATTRAEAELTEKYLMSRIEGEIQ